MRVFGALKADIKFQFKHGFYFVYIALTLMYMTIISQIPVSMSKYIVPVVIFSDPSIVGFFLIGGIVMLEKIQGILHYLVITPLRTKEYLLSKVISLALLAELAGFAIAFVTYNKNFNWLLLGVGILLTSSIFTLYGFIVVSGCNTINQYLIKMVPYMLVIIIPCLLIIKYPYSWAIDIFPGVTGLKLIHGAFNGIGLLRALLYVSYLIISNIVGFVLVVRFFDDRIAHRGEV